MSPRVKSFPVPWKSRLADILRGEAPNEAAEYVVRGKDEKMHYVEVLSNPYFRENEVIGFQGTARDITERKKAEEALRESEEKYRLLVENANEAIFVIQDGMLRFFNIKNIELIGYPKEELTSTPFINFVHPDDREVALGRYLKRIRGEELTGVNVFRIIDKAGNIKWAEVNSVPISWEGRPATLNFLNDITERKRTEAQMIESEERYRTAIEHSNDGVALVRGDKHLYVNKKLVQIFGYERPEEIIGKPHSITVHPDDLGKVMEFDERRKKGEPVPDRYEFKGIRKDGTTIDIEVSATKTSYRGETVSLAYFRDITGRKRAEEEREKLISKLQGALSKVKMLSGLLPICASCKKIRDDKGYWGQIESYIRDHSEAEFSHGICPECMKKLYPDFADDKNSV